jgi:hypothetical protein
MSTHTKANLRLAKKCMAQVLDIAARAAGSENSDYIGFALQELATLLSVYSMDEPLIVLDRDIEYVEIPTNSLRELHENLAVLNEFSGRTGEQVDLEGLTRSRPYHVQLSFRIREDPR